MTYGFLSTLDNIHIFYNQESNAISLEKNNYFTPGFLVVIAALAKYKQVTQDNFYIGSNEDCKGYVSAIALHRAIWGNDIYEQRRINEGRNYSTVVHLSSPDDTNSASSTINSCIRNFISDPPYRSFVAELCEVIGDVHDNVWAHGQSSGFSMAQRRKVSRTESNFYLEFALADCGLGFLSELKRTGHSDIQTDRDAIELCIQEGFSTKKRNPEDEWAQRMPEDMIGNPLIGIENTITSDNHHMGLGLHKLTSLVRKFSGELWLCSGNAVLYIDGNGNSTYIPINGSWKGVAMACRFNSATLYSKASANEAEDKDLERIMDYIGGRNGNS